jgi:hypothetical protein
MLIQEILTRIFNGRNSKLNAGAQRANNSLQVGFAQHPWQVVLLVKQMHARGLQGYVSQTSRLGQKILSDFTWDIWWQSLEVLGEHFAWCRGPRETKFRGVGVSHESLAGCFGRRSFQPSVFRSHCAKMQRAIRRLALRQPSQLRSAGAAAMKRRFGNIIGEVWSWNYNDLGDATDLQGFPWRLLQPRETPSVTRHLDFPLLQWEHMNPFLKEDLDRLCSSVGSSWHAEERVVSLEWQLVFRDLTHLTIPVHFRHPHSLHSELTSHKTTLLQALYSFERAIQGSKLDPELLTEGITPEPIVSWHVTITERLRLPPQCADLFGGLSSGEDDLSTLLQLENRLSIPLSAFQICQDWVPEHSFQPVKTGENEDAFDQSLEWSQHSLEHVAKERPLIICDRPISFFNHQDSKCWRFTERSALKWWTEVKEDNLEGFQRDYYQVYARGHRSLWVFRDQSQATFLQGYYG